MSKIKAILALVVVLALLVIVGLSYKGILPYDFNTVRGYVAIVVIGITCLGVEFIGLRNLPEKGKDKKDENTDENS